MPSLGIFQINAVYDEKLFDIKFNTAQAYKKFKIQGLSAWKNCKNKNNL